jgi:hypothetical protein
MQYTKGLNMKAYKKSTTKPPLSKNGIQKWGRFHFPTRQAAEIQQQFVFLVHCYPGHPVLLFAVGQCGSGRGLEGTRLPEIYGFATTFDYAPDPHVL